MSTTAEFYQIADELRGIALMGMHFHESEYDLERSKRVLAASARLVAILERRSSDEVLEEFEDNLLHVTPCAGADAAVFRDGEILLVQRRDNGLWTMPGGVVDIGETLAEAACRELWEEAGVRGRPVELLGIFDSRLCGSRSKVHSNQFAFLVEAEDPTPTPGPEAVDAGYFSEADLPSLNYGQKVIVPMVFKLVRGEVAKPYFDRLGQSWADQ